jgi:hypothetical protein
MILPELWVFCYLFCPLPSRNQSKILKRLPPDFTEHDLIFSHRISCLSHYWVSERLKCFKLHGFESFFLESLVAGQSRLNYPEDAK